MCLPVYMRRSILLTSNALNTEQGILWSKTTLLLLLMFITHAERHRTLLNLHLLLWKASSLVGQLHRRAQCPWQVNMIHRRRGVQLSFPTTLNQSASLWDPSLSLPAETSTKSTVLPLSTQNILHEDRHKTSTGIHYHEA